jgi:carbamoyl-phosphate synthase small subunit
MLTKIIRKNGVMNGKITTNPPTDSDRAEATAYAVVNPVARVRDGQARPLQEHHPQERPLQEHHPQEHPPQEHPPQERPPQERPPQTRSASNDGMHIALLDFGAKNGISDGLAARGCKITVFPYNATASEIIAVKPDGIMLSNGPGDPADPENRPIVEAIRSLQEKGIPIFGICLGHQLLALANGYPTKKLKFGHRGANQPVKDLRTGRVYITSQNHGYAVVAEEENDSHVTFVNVNDGTCEGMDFGTSFSVQFHPEARGGPLDTGFLFDNFLERIKHAAR